MFSNILVPVDLSDESTWHRPIEAAVGLARQAGATLHVLSVVPPVDSPLVLGMLPRDHEKRMYETARQELSAFVDEHVPDDLDARPQIAMGRVHQEVIRAAAELDCDLIVMGRGGEQRGGHLLGSNTDRVVRHSTIPVMVTD